MKRYLGLAAMLIMSVMPVLADDALPAGTALVADGAGHLYIAQVQPADTFFTPYQENEATARVLDVINHAKAQIRIAIYSFNHPDITQALIDAKGRGVDVELVMDKTQAGGKTEKVQLARLKAAGIKFTIGNSAKHKIMHCKFMVLDDSTIEEGSWNYTVPAGAEDNVLTFVVNDKDRADAFLKYWQQIKQDMQP